jgi:diguanylate cyclase (GGDEF)-like protein
VICRDSRPTLRGDRKLLLEFGVGNSANWASQNEEAIRSALAQPWWRLQFPSDLECRFDQSIAENQSRQTRNNYFLAVFFVNLFGTADYQFLPDVYLTAWLIRFAIITPMFLIVIWAEFYSRAAVRRGIATMALVGVVVVVLFSNLLTDMRFALALVASAIFSLMYLAEITVFLHLPSYLAINYVLVMFSTVSLSLVATYRRERHMRQVFLMLALLEVAEQRQLEANESLRLLADKDPLTGLANRRRLDEEFPKLWREAMRVSSPISVLFLDIDYFKRYNDAYGHAMGDEVLKRFAALLRESAARRPLDIVARNGGEEFLVVLPDTPPAAAAAIARNFLTKLAALAIPHEESSYKVVSASVGIAGGVPLPDESPESYIEQADKAMYRAKNGGRNRVEYA